MKSPPHLREGWNNERLAAFLLSRFSFLAHPASVADDLGSDFFCTLFLLQEGGKQDWLRPRNSFAIQIKSNPRAISFDNKVEYLADLELPFFLGVVDRPQLRMNVYSVELLPLLFASKGAGIRLTLVPCDETDLHPDNFYKRTGAGIFRLKCPFVTAFTVEDSKSATDAGVAKLLDVSCRTRENIATRIAKENVYDFLGTHAFLAAGEGSAKVFRHNFVKRLAEVFFNLDWMSQQDVTPEKLEAITVEFRIFEKLYLELRQLDYPMSELVSERYKALASSLTGGPSL